MELRGKKVTVVGLARSGVGAANILVRLGADVTVTDKKAKSELPDVVARLSPQVRLALGDHPQEIFLSADLIVVSPGVPLGMGQIVSAKSRGVPVIGELELAYRILEDRIPFLAVTGSNGKSTTTTLLDFMLRKGGKRTMLGGNIGNALTEEILKSAEAQKRGSADGKVPGLPGFLASSAVDYAVVEVSSFQLDAIDAFRPRIASVLNITPDHLDRYHSLEEYGRSKARICGNQGEGDFVVLNADDPETERLGAELAGRPENRPGIFYFSRTREVKGLYSRGGKVYCDIPHLSYSPERSFISVEEIRIKGVHNLENAMAASAMALLANCPAGAVIDALREFGGLEHRLELVREIGGVRYVNDSKGTNVGAVMKSVESFDGPVILIAGGRDKAGDFSALRDIVSRKVKALVLIGEASQKIKDALGDVTDAVMAADLREAVNMCRERAEKGDVVLLSPACASFDMFRDFEDRGGKFKEIVMGLHG